MNPEEYAKTIKDLESRFSHHTPKDGQAKRYEMMRSAIKGPAIAIVQNTPKSREQSLALTKLEEAMFWANAAIARNE